MAKQLFTTGDHVLYFIRITKETEEGPDISADINVCNISRHDQLPRNYAPIIIEKVSYY